jgi:quinol monooxygenase YgiN
MSRKAIVVEFPVKPELVQKFVDFTKQHAKRCLDNEPGCLAFDVAVADEDPTTVWIWEVYQDEEALKIHNAKPYLKEFVEGFKPMLARERRRKVVTVAD